MKMCKLRNFTDRTERGAALLSSLLLSTLLLGAGGALIVSTSLTATTAMDSTGEMQAYYGAEAGLQSSLNALRGNVWSSGSTPTIDFRKIVEPAESNASFDVSTVARLSNWFSYSNSTDPASHVVEGANGANVVYDVVALDADNSKLVTYSTSGVFTTNGTDTITLGAGITATLQFYAQPTTSLTAYPTQAGRSLGHFGLSVTPGVGAPLLVIPNNGSGPKFRLRVTQTAPWAASDTFIGTLSGTISATNIALQIDFHGSTVMVAGTKFTLAEDPLSLVSVSTGLPLLPPTVTLTILGSITAPQPQRIVIQSTGYGPKGAKKRLEMVVSNSVLGLDAPAMLTMRGADDCTPMTFDTGSSGAKTYSGMDNVLNVPVEGQLPAFAVSVCDADTAGIQTPGTVTDPKIGVLNNSSVPAGTVPVETPDFLKTADNARALLKGLQDLAASTGRYFNPAAGSSTTVSAANTGPNKLTFVDGDCTLDGGDGLLVVTGKLFMNGNASFTGVVLVLGGTSYDSGTFFTGGYVNRNGNGNIYGAMIVARFDRTGPGGFLAPYFNTNGGGNSTMQYDSAAVNRANQITSTAIAGVREF